MSTVADEAQFVDMAAAEKLIALDTEEGFDGRAARAALAAFDRIKSRAGGEPPVRGMSGRGVFCYIFNSCLRMYLLAYRLK